MTRDLDTFTRHAAQHRVVPVWRTVLSDMLTPASTYARLADAAFILESVERDQSWGRYSFVGADVGVELAVNADGTTSVQAHEDPWVEQALIGVSGAFDSLQAASQLLRGPTGDATPALPLHGGLVGYVTWDAVRDVEDIGPDKDDALGLGTARFVFPRVVVGLDHRQQSATVVINVLVPPNADADALGELFDAAQSRLDDVMTQLATPADEPVFALPAERPVPTVPDANVPAGQYQTWVRTIQEHIRAGDVFQTVPSQRFEVPTAADPLTVYRALRHVNPSPYLFLLQAPGATIIGSSPEALVRVTEGQIETWPIAGTRPRGSTAAEDDALEAGLLADDKERAEHVMLVDLARNDVGRVAEVGSVEVTDFMQVRRFSHVMHITSEVVGQLRPELDAVDALRALFPAGTVSGAPKVRAMQLINELEPTRRGLYAGAVGYVDTAGNLDTCIALRTLVLRDGVAYVQAGGGIVLDSDPDTEDEETRNKAKAVLTALALANHHAAGESAHVDS